MKEIKIRTKCLHRDTGEMVPAVVACTPGEPLKIMSYGSACDIDVNGHIALARCDPHVHGRQCVVPSRQDFEEFRIHETDFYQVVAKAHQATQSYCAYRASLAALKGGIWLIGCMGNTPWGPIGEPRWRQTLELYRRQSLVFAHVWPRMEPGVLAIPSQEGKDFGSTFGLSRTDRDSMFALWTGCDVSFHNDMPRPGESIADFYKRCTGPEETKFHLYYGGETVLASQRETIALARRHSLRSLRARHVPTGPALQMLLNERMVGGLKLPIEVGLDYLYWNRAMVIGHPTGMINYRRPAFPSVEDQLMLITLLKENANDPTICLASDHAPHSLAAKQFKDGLPGSPGTRVLEHSHQLHMHLIHHHGFFHHQIDRLAAIHPAQYLERYFVGGFPYPIAKMETGAMCNLVVFDPDCYYRPDETALRAQLQDPEYHTVLREKKLRGKVWFTVVNGRVFDVSDDIRTLN